MHSSQLASIMENIVFLKYQMTISTIQTRLLYITWLVIPETINGYERYMPALLYLGTLTYVSVYVMSCQSDVPVLSLLFVVVWFGCGSVVDEATRLVVWEEGLTPTRVGSGVVRCCVGDVGDGAVNDMALWMESE